MEKDTLAPHPKAMTPAEAEAFFSALGEKPYRGRQLLEWIHVHGAETLDEMTSLSKDLRRRLSERMSFEVLTLRDQVRDPDGTVKVVFRTEDDLPLEAVLIPRGTFRTACVSTQAGCPLRCAFCATGTSGYHRNLTPEEIVDQALHLKRLEGKPGLLTHVVFMGMGEPLLNVENVFRAVRVLTHPGAGALSPSRITISTAGIVEGLKRLSRADLRVNVALSLNATREPLRCRLMPVTKLNPLSEVLDVFGTIPATRRDPRTLEYVLLSGVNDSPSDASDLARIARTAEALVNLIPYNEVEGLPFRAPSEEVVETFLQTLVASGVSATVRRSRGARVGAACGQLAGRG